MTIRPNIDTVTVIEPKAIEKRRLDKGRILAFKSAGNAMTHVVYDSGVQGNPDKFVIQDSVEEFQIRLNGFLPLSVLKQRLEAHKKQSNDKPLKVIEKFIKKSHIQEAFIAEAEAVKAKHRDQDQYWFMPDANGNYKNIAAETIYEVQPNPNSPWAREL